MLARTADSPAALRRSQPRRHALVAVLAAALTAPMTSCLGTAAAVGHRTDEPAGSAEPARSVRGDLQALGTALGARASAFWSAFEELEEATRPRVVEVVLRNQLGEQTTFELPEDGVFADDEQAVSFARFLRCRRSGRRRKVAPATIAMLARIGKQFPGREIEIVSGYRHPPHASRSSRHAQARAIDLRVEGVSAGRLRDFVWGEYGDAEVGVGFYLDQSFVHIDARPGHPATAWTQRRVNQPYRYDPPWSRRRASAEVAMAEQEPSGDVQR